MTMHFSAKCPPLLIGIGETTSNVYDETVLHDAVGFLLGSPSGLAETVSLQVSWDNSTWFTLYSRDTDEDQIVAPAGKAIYTELPRAAKYFRLLANVGVAAERTFLVIKDFTT